MFKECNRVSEIITENSLEPYDMYLGSLNSMALLKLTVKPKRAIVLWDERDQAVGNYASHYLRRRLYCFGIA